MGWLKSYENQKFFFDVKNLFLVVVIINWKLNQGIECYFMYLELDILDFKIRYEFGDYVVVYLVNDFVFVNQLGKILGVDLDVVMFLNNLDEEFNKKYLFLCFMFYCIVFIYYLDIINFLCINVLYELVQYVLEFLEQELLCKMVFFFGEGKELYLSWVVEVWRYILVILQDCLFLWFFIDYLCELLLCLQVCYYFIVLFFKVYFNFVYICVVVVEYEIKVGCINKGVVINWLWVKEFVGENGGCVLVFMFVCKFQFCLFFKVIMFVIMVGFGIGVVFFIGFIQEWVWL